MGRLLVMAGVVLVVAGGCSSAQREGVERASTQPATRAIAPVAEGEVTVRLEDIRVAREGMGVRVRCTNNTKEVLRISSWSLSWLTTQVILGAPDATFWQIATKGAVADRVPREEDFAMRLNPGESAAVEVPPGGLSPRWHLQSVSSRRGEVPREMRFAFPSPLLNVADRELRKEWYVPVTTTGTTRVEVEGGVAGRRMR